MQLTGARCGGADGTYGVGGSSYEIIERLGSGAGATVYRAVDAGGRTVAVKELHRDIAHEPAARRRLAAEVAALSRVRSPYVVKLLDADIDGGRPFIALEHVAGRTVQEMADTYGGVGEPVLSSFARRLAEGLAAIHAQGIVHRDLKPGNVMVADGTGDPVVIDFGISHETGAGEDTQPGMLVGTPSYLAPELIDTGGWGSAAQNTEQPPGDGRASEASDVFAWAATMAFAATGRSPFGEGSPHAVCFRILRGGADLAGVPESLQQILRPALRRDPRGRPPASWLARELSRVQTG